ncbi:sphingomyelin phosphodiesterase-like isoform X2 [Euwallacea fornicatus]|uniref:sphingomyelin phosphodiesterase-like isoform X2 n=1 Tax=Euwallacea fornicatus TaxID=995702 RepID=UPI00338EB8F3
MSSGLRWKILVGILILKFSEELPIQTKINFDDKWNYKTNPSHVSPMLNGSYKTILMPLYTFSHDLKIVDFDENLMRKSSLPERKESRVTDDMILRTKVSCGICNLGVGLLFTEVKNGHCFDEIKTKFVSLCVALKIESLNVCSGIFDTYGPEVIPVIELTSLGPTEVCKLIFGEICPVPDVNSHEWIVELPKTASPPLKTSPLTRFKEGLSVFKVLQISDTHYDLDYAEGAVANCEEPLCCRNYSTPRTDEDLMPAGRWGSYEKCDAPRAMLQNMFDFIALQHPDIDYILWTGDIPPHDIWNQTKENNLNVIEETIDMIFKAFPNTPIFPAIGNHESSPAGNFAPPWMTNSDHSISWLYDKISPSWLKWLPPNAEPTVRHGAFYSVLLRPGFRLISINTNYCHSLSWWLLVNSTDPASELKWLIHELQGAEDRDEKTHIIGHISPGSADCMKSWSKNFYDIVNRYEGTVKALFYGHSHADEFQLFYETVDEYSRRPTAVAYLAPSVTTFTNHNPAFRIYYVDGDHENTTRDVLEHETWTFDMEMANKLPNNEPQWYKLYSATETYEMENLSPSEWNKVVERMMIDDDLFQRFYKNYYRNSPTAPDCDTKCKIQILCDLKSAKSHSRRQLCNEINVFSL